MKWNNNDVKYERGNYECLIAQFDKTGSWVCLRAMATQQTQKHTFKDLGEALSAKEVEVKRFYDDNDEPTETNVIAVMNMKAYGGGFKFYKENEDESLTPINQSEIHRYLPILTYQVV